jgi:MarR family transcriptional regulator, temperature-dependent positive regulator of motility
MMDRSLLQLLLRATGLADNAFLSGVTGTTPRQFAILVAIDENEGASQQALSERTGIDGATLGEIVRRLVLRNLVRRRRTNGDGRAYAVKLTSKGQRLLRRARPLAKRVDQRVLSALPKDRRERFLDLLAAIPSKLDRDRGS